MQQPDPAEPWTIEQGFDGEEALVVRDAHVAGGKRAEPPFEPLQRDRACGCGHAAASDRRVGTLEMLREEISARGPMRVTEIDAAKREIVATAQRLEREGAIILTTDARDMVS